MVQTIDPMIHADSDVSRFYDRLSDEYDLMTDLGSRFVREKPFFRLLVERHNIRSAVDIGAGTGFHSLLLAQLGVRVTAVDPSAGMIRRLVENAAAHRLTVDTHQGMVQDLDPGRTGPMDAVFCLGNTLAHCASTDEVRALLCGSARLLAPGGILFLQVLNYDRILNRGVRIQSAKEAGGVTFVRFYDFTDQAIVFNILRLRDAGGRIEPDLQSIPLMPVTPDLLIPVLREAGFRGEQLFGGISMERFEPSASQDLVILASKPAEGR